MLEEAACAKRAFPLYMGLFLATMDLPSGPSRGGMRLASMYPYILPGNKPAEGQGSLAAAASGTACLMASLLVNMLDRQQQKSSPLLHLDCDMPDIEHYE